MDCGKETDGMCQASDDEWDRLFTGKAQRDESMCIVYRCVTSICLDAGWWPEEENARRRSEDQMGSNYEVWHVVLYWDVANQGS